MIQSPNLVLFGHASPSNANLVEAPRSRQIEFISDCSFGRSGGYNGISSSLEVNLDFLMRAASELLGREVSLTEPRGFLQSPGGGLELHSDPVDVISWQIEGLKRWRFFSAEQMPPEMRALRVVFRNEGGGPIVSDFYRQTEFKNSTERELGPGEFLIMPRFTLHETVALTQAFSISATIQLFGSELADA